MGLHFDILLDDMVARAATLVPAYHRGEVLRLPGGVTLIDDSHNSSPAALGRALETMAAATGSARKVGVLGEMLELGEFSEQLHRQAGRRAAEAGLDLLIGVGGSVVAAMTAEAVRASPSVGSARELEGAGGRPGARSRPCRRSGARQRVAGNRNRSGGGTAQGGVCLMRITSTT